MSLAEPQPRLRHIQHAIAGKLSFTVTELTVPSCPDLILFVETPANEQTRTQLPLTRRNPAAV